MRNPKSILITGASSGIGKALAETYALPGNYLFLTGRNKERLDEVAANCRNSGAKVETAVIEIEDANTLRMWISACDKVQALDLVIANAGISNARGESSELQDRKIFSTNLNGALNTIYPAISIMQSRKHGQIAIISSLSAMHGFPFAGAYCASKAAVKVFGEALRVRLKKDHVEVCVVCPGFIATPLTEDCKYYMPFIMNAQKAAKIIKHGLAKNKGLLAFPRRLYSLLWLLRLFPAKWVEQISCRL